MEYPLCSFYSCHKPPMLYHSPLPTLFFHTNEQFFSSNSTWSTQSPFCLTSCRIFPSTNEALVSTRSWPLDVGDHRDHRACFLFLTVPIQDAPWTALRNAGSYWGCQFTFPLLFSTAIFFNVTHSSLFHLSSYVIIYFSSTFFFCPFAAMGTFCFVRK